MTDHAFTQAGGCHCRAFRYTVSAPPLRTYACHCTDCQNLSGSAFGIGCVFRAEDFSYTGTPKLVSRVLGSGGVGIRWTCAECGVWICGEAKPDKRTGIERRIVRGGTFDDRSWIQPAAHMWTRSKQPWVTIPDGVPAYETNPQ